MSQSHSGLASEQRAVIENKKYNIAKFEEQRAAQQQHRSECQLMNKPKRPTNAFGLFRQKANKMPKMGSVLWRNMSAADQQPYFDLYKVKYDQYQ